MYHYQFTIERESLRMNLCTARIRFASTIMYHRLIISLSPPSFSFIEIFYPRLTVTLFFFFQRCFLIGLEEKEFVFGLSSHYLSGVSVFGMGDWARACLYGVVCCLAWCLIWTSGHGLLGHSQSSDVSFSSD